MLVATLFHASIQMRDYAWPLTSIVPVVFYLLFATAILAKDVWFNPLGQQEDSQYNYQYRTLLE